MYKQFFASPVRLWQPNNSVTKYMAVLLNTNCSYYDCTSLAQISYTEVAILKL